MHLMYTVNKDLNTFRVRASMVYTHPISITSFSYSLLTTHRLPYKKIRILDFTHVNIRQAGVYRYGACTVRGRKTRRWATDSQQRAPVRIPSHIRGDDHTNLKAHDI